ncbi:MAG TPA: glycosyltransferase family 4 protein [Methylocystis sp.]|nr:glycosyltransferase family 4 protein [Methylocystis sp.]
MTRIVFAIPGDLAAPTGGYGYDRRVLAELPRCGVDTAYCALPGSFPAPNAEDIEKTIAVINRGAREGAVVLIDGLAYGALPESMVRTVAAPIVALCHHPLCCETGLSSEQKEALRASEQRALALASRIVATSAHTKTSLETDFELPAEKISVALPGTDRAPRAQGSCGAPALLAVGSIIPRKAFDLLVDALAGLKDLDWRLRIAGSLEASPQTTRALAQRIAATGLGARVELLGALSPEQLDGALGASDIFVSSSLYEGYGMALAEALARGLPIVTTTAGAATETVPDAAALKVPVRDVSALRAALRSVIADRSLRAKLSEEAWRAGQALPSWEDTAQIIAGVAREAAGSR